LSTEPIVLLSADAETRAALRARVPNLQVANSAGEAADLLDAVRQGGQRQPIAILDPPADPAAAAALARRLRGGDQTASALLITITNSAQPGILAEPARSLFVTSLPRPIESTDIGVVVAIAAGCRHGTESSNFTALSAAAPQANLSILVAEDNRTNQKVIRKILSRAGHTATIVENGEAALEALHQHDFDLVLMDVNMPVMNGIEATKLYRFGELGRKHVPIVALTADASPETDDRCRKAGMDGCLTKPIEPAQLIAAIGRLVAAKAVATSVGDIATPDLGPIYWEPGAVPPAIDLDKLEELERLGGPEFVEDLAQQFLDDAIVVLRELAKTVRDGDVEGFREQAHALRSGAANIGARAIYELCLAWRQIDADALRAEGAIHIGELASEFDRVRTALKSKAAA
jgi:two-component system sensor histidine kinase RpfC